MRGAEKAMPDAQQPGVCMRLGNCDSVTPRTDRLSLWKADLRIRWASVSCEAEYLEFRREFGPIGTFAGKVRKCRWAPSDGTFGSIVTITIASLSAVVTDLSAKIE